MDTEYEDALLFRRNKNNSDTMIIGPNMMLLLCFLSLTYSLDKSKEYAYRARNIKYPESSCSMEHLMNGKGARIARRFVPLADQ